MVVRKLRGVAAAAVVVAAMGLAANGAEAQILGSSSSAAAGKWFAEGNVGAAWADFVSFRLGGAELSAADSGGTSLAASAGVGFFITNQLYARVAYRYFGSFDTTGDFAGTTVKFESDAHGLMFGLGFNADLSREVFIEATGEIGAAFISTSGSNLGLGSSNETNFAGGVGLGLGFRVTSSTDLLVMGNYHWLGDSGTASTSGLLATATDLSVGTVTVGARIKF